MTHTADVLPITAPTRTELWRRHQLARAILDQREPNATTLTLALCALDGVSLETLISRPINTKPQTVNNTTGAINWLRITQDLRVAMLTRNISQRAIARATGVSNSVLTRLLQGNGVSSDVLAALVVWLYPEDDTPRWITREVIRGA